MDFLEKDEEEEEFKEFSVKSMSMDLRMPSLHIPISYLRDISFLNWLNDASAKTWLYMYSFIIRSPMKNKMAKHLYDVYYKNNLLVARFTQQHITDIFGYSKRSTVNNHITKLIKESALVKHNCSWRGRQISVYEFGRWEFVGGQKQETIYAFENIVKISAEAAYKKFLPES